MEKNITPEELDSLSRACFSFMVKKDVDIIAQFLSEDLVAPDSVVYPFRVQEKLAGALIAVDLSNRSVFERDICIGDNLYWAQHPEKSEELAESYTKATGIACKINYFANDFTSPSFSSDKNVIYISLLAVHPEFQRRGIAKGLLNKFLQDYFANELYTNCNNHSEKLFRDRGFMPIIQRSSPNSSGIPHLFMGRLKTN